MLLPTGGTPVAKLNRVDIECIRSEFEAIRYNVQWQLAGSGNQTGINYKETDDLDSRHISLTAPRGGGTDKNILKEGPVIHRKYTYYNVEYNNTLIKSILEHYDCFGSRITVVEPSMCLRWHDDRAFNFDDSYYRLHIPIYSDPGNHFAFDSGLYRLEPGWLYLVDTTRKHTFFNASHEDRYHIIGNTDMTKKMNEVLATGDVSSGWGKLDKGYFNRE